MNAHLGPVVQLDFTYFIFGNHAYSRNEAYDITLTYYRHQKTLALESLNQGS
jgi:hypothetical protein